MLILELAVLLQIQIFILLIGVTVWMVQTLQKKRNAPVVIKDLAFIGMHSIILKGVTIGEKSIIGAGSVVSKDVPDGEIWAGNPARFIKKVVD